MPRLSRLVMAAAIVATTVVGTASLARAQSVDYGETCALAFTPPSPFDPGQSVRIDGTGFQPDFTTEILFDGQPAAPAGVTPAVVVTTDPLGNFSTSIQIPPTAAPGTHTISVICDADVQVAREFRVQVRGQAPSSTPPTVGGRTTTPRTGSDTQPLVAIGAGAVLAGTAIVLATRRRRQQEVRA
jgi:LPXTG-motif cell wall-anchored protein